MNKPTLHGIVTVTSTPFREDGSIDYDGVEQNLEWQIKKGVHGLLPLGATGEYGALSMQERLDVAHFFLAKVNQRVPVIVGAISSTAETTIDISRHAADHGAAAVMILPPPGTHPSQDEIFNYYKTISENVPLPVMIYNNPGSSGVDIAPGTLEKITTLPMMHYIKESTGDIRRMTGILDALDGRILPFCGCEELAYESFMLGARGWICVIGNFAPGMAVELYRRTVEEKDFAGGWALYRKMLPMLGHLEQSGRLWQTVKYVQNRIGLAGGKLRSPRLPLTTSQMYEVDKILEANPLY